MTAQEFADAVTSGNAPWLNSKGENNWSDSTKEQYFNFLTAEQANQMELERWRLNNEYNTPRAQMMRMIEAGMNPAAAYQQVSSGNSQSVPDTHQPGSAAFHDTSDKLQRINTIMNGISSIMSTIQHGVGAVQGIQDIGVTYQANALNNLRYNYMYPFGSGKPASDVLWLGTKDDAAHWDSSIEVAPGLYMNGITAQLFPELIPETGFSGGKYHQGQTTVDIQSQLADRRTRIDDLIQSIMHGLETNASNEVMLKLFMQLFMYGAMSKFGGF